MPKSGRGGPLDEDGEWPRKELGNDEDAWAWALGQLGKDAIIALSTYSEEGPRVRPVTVVPFEGRAYVVTGTRDAKVRQLEGDPRFEFYVLVKEGESTGYVRFRGTAHPVEDPVPRKEVGDASGFLTSYWTGPDDPDYTLLWLDITAAEVMRPGVKGYELLTR